MKPGISPVKKRTALILLVLYLFFNLVCILYLPNYNLTERRMHVVSNSLRLHRGDGSANASIRFHHIFKSVIINKSNTLICVKALTVLFIIFFAGSGLFLLPANQKSYIKLFFYYRPYTFLGLCPLRIWTSYFKRFLQLVFQKILLTGFIKFYRFTKNVKDQTSKRTGACWW